MSVFNRLLREETYKIIVQKSVTLEVAISHTTSQILMHTGAHSSCCIIFKTDGACLVPKLLSISIFKYKSGKFPPNLCLKVSMISQQLDLFP